MGKDSSGQGTSADALGDGVAVSALPGAIDPIEIPRTAISERAIVTTGFLIINPPEPTLRAAIGHPPLGYEHHRSP